ncbi:MAG: DUF3857 domain-containing protein [Thermoanaerobaculia bacterium]
MKRLRPIFPLCLALVLPALRAAAADGFPATFPPITDEERALTSVPGAPNAPAVVLFKRGEFLIAGHGFGIGSLSSHLRVQARVKILTEAGKGNGEIAIDHSNNLRLRSFIGRTVLPNGRILGASQFQRRTSKSSGTFVTTAAFPAVQAGAILDYQYEIGFSSPFVLEPWYLSEELPVRHAEIVFKMPRHLKVMTWTRAPLGARIQRQEEDSINGFEVRAWADDLPAVPDVPYAPPFNDLASQIVVLPTAEGDNSDSPKLLSDWISTTYLLNRVYMDIQAHGLGIQGPAREIAGSGSPRQKAEALYRYVRDHIRTEPGGGVLIDPETRLRKILNQGSGTSAEKALLLQEMLRKVGIDSNLVWAADRNRGTLDPNLPSPMWFDTMLVEAFLDGRSTFLDPSAPELAFGQLRPGHEGSPALAVYGAQRIRLPETPFDQNLRRAEIELALDGKGRLAGTGTLRLAGLPALERLHWRNDAAQTAQAWTDWLRERFHEFRIADVRVDEAAEERRVTVTWSMAQLEEEVLGDEAALVPSAPLGPVTQPFVQTAAERKIEMVFDYPARDEVELRLSWSDGWSLDQRPQPSVLSGLCGALSSSMVLDAGKRMLVYRRRFDITRRRLGSKPEYEAVRGLFGAVEKNDAQKLTLVRR